MIVVRAVGKVDEIHNLRTNHQAGSEAASALKVFSERLDATFLYAGIDLLQSDLLSGHMGRQIKGRITIHEMRPYSNGTRAQRDAWEELVLGIETLLPLGRHAGGSMVSLTSYLYDRTGGSIGSLRALLSDAAIAAILDGAEKVDRKLLDTIPTDHAAEEFRTRTPVTQDASPTPLRRGRMTLHPLPVPTRVYGGEGVVSYSHRHAARNHGRAGEIEIGVRERGIRLGRGHSAPERNDVWRQLGNLHPSAFTTLTKSGSDPISDRRLCLRCTQGNPAVGRLPHVGLVCLRHKRWIGNSQQVDLHTHVPALTAERHFRNHLAARGVLFDSFAMELGRACANPVFVGVREIERRRQQTGIETVAALVYPEQIKFARMLTSPAFLEFVTDPGRDAGDRCGRITREAAKILPVWDDSESWRVTERIWDVARQLTQLRRDSLLWGAPVRDAYYNLLRFIELPDLVIDDKWDDYGIRPATHLRGDHAVADHGPA